MKFLDTITLSINELNREISSLKNLKKEEENKVKKLTDELDNLRKEYQLFKNKFKYIKEEDILDNRSNFELLKKVNRYEKKLSELGVDISKI